MSPSIQNNSGLPQGRQGPGAGKLGSVSGDPPAETKARRREIMMHPHLPGPLPVAVPDIGFPQHISIGQKAFDSSSFADLSGDHCDFATRPLDRIVWLPSPRPPYRNLVEAANDVATGRIQLNVTAYAIVRPQVQAGKRCIHDTPPYSSNFDVIRAHLS